MVKQMGAKNVKVVKETPSAAGATLDVTGSDPTGGAMKGTITRVKEAGAWKIDKESWSNQLLRPLEGCDGEVAAEGSGH